MSLRNLKTRLKKLEQFAPTAHGIDWEALCEEGGMERFVASLPPDSPRPGPPRESIAEYLARYEVEFPPQPSPVSGFVTIPPGDQT